MNIQNVQIQAFLQRKQSKIMRKIEDEYYCEGCIFQSQEQLDKFKQVWQQKLKQQFVIQNQQYLSKTQNNTIDELPSNLNQTLDNKQNNEIERNPYKMLKIEANESISDDINSLKNEKNDNSFNKNETKESNIQVKNEDNNKKQLEQKQEQTEEIDYMKLLERSKFQSNEKEEENLDGDKKVDENCNFSLDSDDLDDVSDQIIDEGYFNDFDNYLIGYIGKERKTKKKCKEQNKPITSIDFQNLIGNINKQEIILASLRANLVDCRK